MYNKSTGLNISELTLTKANVATSIMHQFFTAIVYRFLLI